MIVARYTVAQYPVQTILSWIQSGELAVPEIQRPFVWDAAQVRDLLDSLLQGYPVGYLICSQNPKIHLKDGSIAIGKRMLIDGQQRVTALMAAILGHEVVNKDYEAAHIKIAYQPIEHQFEVSNASINKNKEWVSDIASVFQPTASSWQLVEAYCADNPGQSKDEVSNGFEMLRGIVNNQIGMIELAPDLDVETVTEIFVRVNSKGVQLSQADFVMSKIAVNEKYGGDVLRKAIDYFCHLAAEPGFYAVMQKDTQFAATEYSAQMAWLKGENDDLYDPSYSDMLRVAFTSQFGRGKLQDLVALLSGRNFETKKNEEEIVESSFNTLRTGVMSFMKENNFKQFIMIIRSTGFVASWMITSEIAMDFAYILYLTLRDLHMPMGDIQHWVARWFVVSVLTSRYSGSTESTIEEDIRQIREQGMEQYGSTVIRGELSDAFWDTVLPQDMETSAVTSPAFRAFEAAQVKTNALGFLSSDYLVKDLVEVKADVHHIWPRDFLKTHGVPRSEYNQIANFALTQSEINIAIGNKEPRVYMAEMLEQCRGGPKRYGNIASEEQLRENLAMNCIPQGFETMTIDEYPRFLDTRRRLMAQYVRRYFEKL